MSSSPPPDRRADRRRRHDGERWRQFGIVGQPAFADIAVDGAVAVSRGAGTPANCGRPPKRCCPMSGPAALRLPWSRGPWPRSTRAASRCCPPTSGCWSPARQTGAVPRALRFAGGMTVGFVAVFGLVGVLLAPLALSLERYLPAVAVVVGVLLVGLGCWLLAGKTLAVPGLAGRGSAPTERWWSQIGYGVSFALASLSCTIAPFLAAVAGSLRAGGPLGVAAAFVAYALGMGVVVLAVALAVATASARAVRACAGPAP